MIWMDIYLMFKCCFRGVMSVMQADPHLYPDNYTPVGDLSVIAICLVMLALIAFSYNRKTISFRVFMTIVPSLMLSAALSVTYNFLASRLGAVPIVYILRCVFHAVLFMLFFEFALYIAALTRIELGKTKLILSCILTVIVAIVIIDVVLCVNAFRQTDASAGLSSNGHMIFLIGYLVLAGSCVALMASVRKRLYKRVMWGFYMSVVIAFIVLLTQRVFGSGSSFTVVTFLFPVLAMYCTIHANPYDAELGAVDSSALAEVVQRLYSGKKPFIILSLYLPVFSAEGKQIPDTIRSLVRRFSVNYFRRSMLFQIDNGHLMLIFRKAQNPDYEHRIEKILRAFRSYHKLYQYGYKIVIGESIDEISKKNEYISFIRNINRNLPENTIHRISQDDIISFNRMDYILQQLADIHHRHDLDDPRVLVYCQPVYNVRLSGYDTAEALMRLQLDELGLVLPDDFIYLAEEHGYIHTLTEIILHKTCLELRSMLDSEYVISRISVNVSMLELRSAHFCDDISRIIINSGVPSARVAIELTESQSESEFDMMKDKILELKESGIKFYLDDFGTGYSNMERIIELPFDIIKFDHSLVTASSTDERSEKIVHNMANLFNDLHYSILYEGIETDSDETRCREMSASYLQGFKFSRPVPIADLRKFVEKKNAG